MPPHQRNDSAFDRNVWNYDNAKLPDPDAMRVMKLRSALDINSAVECELLVLSSEHDAQAEGRSYEALSWTWGKGEPQYEIYITHNDRRYSFKVVKHLLEALKALRLNKQGIPRYLWVDAICINQDDLDEKNQQIPRMDQIYGSASNVCVWLGVAHDNSDAAMSFICDEVLKLWTFDKLCKDLSNRDNWNAMMHLMKWPWFSRRWIVQEIALARQATVHCGDKSINWTQFANAVSLFVTASRRLSKVIKHDESTGYTHDYFLNVPTLGAARLVETTDLLFRTSPSGDLIRLSSLENLVSRLPIFAASEPRDTIYALLAMASDSTPRRQAISHVPELVNSAAMQRHGERGDVNPTQTDSPPNDPGPCLIFPGEGGFALLGAYVPYRKDSALKLLRRFEGRKLTRAEIGAILETVKQRLGGPHQESYAVDYRQSVIEIYKQFIAFAIRKSDQTRALDIICRPWAAPITYGDEWKYLSRTERESLPPRGTATELSEAYPLPSWMPPTSRSPFQMTDENRIRNAGRSRPASPGDSGNDEFFHKGSRRVHADSLVGNPDSRYRAYTAAGTRTINRTKLRFRRRREHYSMFVEGFVLDTVQRVHEPSSNGNIPREWARAIGWKNFDQDPPDSGAWNEFWRTLVADRGPYGTNPPLFYAVSCKEAIMRGKEKGIIDTNWLIQQGQCTIIASFLRRVQAIIWDRRLIHTEGGQTSDGSPMKPRLGLASRDTLQNDLVCILYGCSVPVILRRKHPTTHEMEANEEYDKKQLEAWACGVIADGWKKRLRERQKAAQRRRERLPDDEADDLLQSVSSRLATWYRKPRKTRQPRSLSTRLIKAHTRRYWLITGGLYAAYTGSYEIASWLLLTLTLASILALVPHELSDITWFFSGSRWKGSRPRLTTRTLSYAVPTIELAIFLSYQSMHRATLLPALVILTVSMIAEPKLRPENVWYFLSSLRRQIRRPDKQRHSTLPDSPCYYEVIGEAYIHGMMNGEAIKWQNDTQTKPQVFELR